MDQIKNYILEQVSNKKISQEDAFSMLKELKNTDELHEEVAIIGLACTLPEAGNPEEFWDNLINEYKSLVPSPPERYELFEPLQNPHYAEFLGMHPLGKRDNSEESDKNLVAFIKDIDKFDAAFFGIPPREARFIHPGQRIFLQTAWSAIEDAGYGYDTIVGSNTGVFVGEDHNNTLPYKYITEPDQMHLTGSWEGIMASRISYIFDLKGPAMVLDTACSSGLIAVHQACNALRNKDCEMVIAGGISLGGGTTGTALEEGDEDTADALASVSSDDVVRAFDKKCSGTVFGEGCVAITLKLLKNAIKDGDHIYGVIKGSAINNDGASNGITAPNPLAQEEVIKEAWEKSNVNCESIQYIEAHGTGTILGDPIEIKGITNAFRKYTRRKQFCGVGSLKTNMGHMVAAAGCASVMKVVLSMKHNVIPASMYFEEPNPHINFCESPVFVVDKPFKWNKREIPRRAGVSAFGFSGTNGHAIIEEPPVLPERIEVVDNKLNVVCLSAKTETALINLIKSYQTFLANNEELNIKDVCFTANTGRGHYDFRIAMLVDGQQSFQDNINLLVNEGLQSSMDRKIYFGQYKTVSDRRQSLNENEVKESSIHQMNSEVEEQLNHIDSLDDNRYNVMLESICEAYTKGATIAWKKLYINRQNRRVSLPTYQFDKTFYWANVKKTKLTNSVVVDNSEKIHPLVDKLVVSTMNEDIYSVKLSPNSHWVLKEHVILGNSTVPGTAYIEVARAIGERYYKTDALELENVMFLTPLVVPNDSFVDAQIVAHKDVNKISFVISSLVKDEKNESETWVIYCKGDIKVNTNATSEKLEYNQLFEQEGIVNSPTNIPAINAQGLMGLGDRWNNVLRCGRLDNIAVCEVKLPDEYKGDLEQFKYHISVLDMAVNRPVQEFTSGIYLPYYYKKLTMYAPLPGHVFSKAILLNKNSNNDETKTYDIIISDIDGNVIVTIEGYVVKKVNVLNDYVANAFFGIEWVEVESGIASKNAFKNVLMFRNKTKFSSQLEEKVKNSAQRVITVDYGKQYEKVNENEYIISTKEEDYYTLMKDIASCEITDIVHTKTLDFDMVDKDIIDYEDAQKNSIYSLFFITKSMLKNKIGRNINFILVTDYAQEIDKTERTIKPLNAAFIALAKTINMEYPDIKIRSIDIDESTDFDRIYEEIQNGEYYLRTAFRNNKKYRERLYKKDLTSTEKKINGIKVDGTYIITGGTGGLGLEVARYLSMKNKCNIILISRKTLPDRTIWADIIENGSDQKLCKIISKINDIENENSNVEVLSGNVNDYTRMNEIIEYLITKYQTINGVFHCAGIAGDGFLYNKSEEMFANVLEPKIAGTKVMEACTRELNLDFMIVFSSMITFFSAPGQGDYTVANAYLDSFAQYRNKTNQRTYAINWPGWSETGMAVDHNLVDGATLFKSLTTNQALSALDTVLSTGITNIIPGEMDYDLLSTVINSMPMTLSSEIEKIVARRKDTGEVKQRSNKSYENIESREVLILGKAQDEFTETEIKLSKLYAAVLELTEIDIYESFNAMGGDSIIATEVYKLLNHFYEGVSEVSDMFVYPTIFEMAHYIDSKLQNENSENVLLTEHNIDNMMEKFEEGEIDVDDMISFFDSEEE